MNIDQTKLKIKGDGEISINGDQLNKAKQGSKGGISMNIESVNPKMKIRDRFDI